MKDWIKAGGDVLVRSGYGWNTQYTKGTIERLTATQIILKGGRKYRISDQGEIGRSLGCTLVAIDDEHALAVMAEAARKNNEWAIQNLAEEFRKAPSTDAMDALKLAIAKWDAHK